MNGLGFNRFVAGYLVGVKTDGGGTLPSITTPWVINKFASDWFSICSRTPGSAYPFIGGTEYAHSRDLFLRRNITWLGTVTHNASGIQGNGTDGGGLFGLSREIFPDINRYSVGIYSNTNVASNPSYDIGNLGIGQICLNSRLDSTNGALFCTGNNTVNMRYNSGHSFGLYWQRRDSAGVSYGFYNNNVAASANTVTQGTVPGNTYICTLGSPPYYSTRRYGFAFVCPAILDTVAPYPLIQALQTHCGRAV